MPGSRCVVGKRTVVPPDSRTSELSGHEDTWRGLECLSPRERRPSRKATPATRPSGKGEMRGVGPRAEAHRRNMGG